MKISQIFPSKYITAADLQGRTITLTIKAVTLEEMITHDSKKANKPVAWFERTEKGFVMNMTNAKIIAALYGDDTTAWIGERVSLYPTRVKAFGSVQDCIRVREEVPAKPKPATPAAQAEEPSVDDDEDVADYEEDEPTRVIDASTGEIIEADADFDALWNKPDVPAAKRTTHDVVSNAQLMRIFHLGADAFGPTWDDNIVRLCERVSGGARTVLGDLYPLEGDKMIKGLEAKIRNEGLYADRAKLASDDAAAARIDPLPKAAVANGVAA